MAEQLSSFGVPGIGWGWVLALGTLGISCLGIYAGSSEKPLAFKIFAGFMVVGLIVMMSFGIYIAVSRNAMKQALVVESDTSKTLMQEEVFRSYLDILQPTLSCCGLTSAADWGSNIPDSCACNSRGQQGFFGSGCRSRPLGTTGPSQINSQPCGEILFNSIEFVFKILMGIFFGFAVTALLGLLMSILMLHQIKRYDGAGSASFSMKG